MLVIETKLKKLPEKCNKCKYSYTNGGYGYGTERFCAVSFQKDMCRPCPIEYVPEKRNYKFQRPDWCPLKEIQDD